MQSLSNADAVRKLRRNGTLDRMRKHQRHLPLSRTFIRILHAGLTLVVFPINAALAEDRWRVSEHQAACLIENKTAYLALESDVLIIDVGSCPDPSPFAGAMDGLSNFGGISEIQSRPSSAGLDSIITYTRQEIQCLDASEIVVENGTALLPRVVKCDD
jgi:hypothetical protein